ncbi:MAG: hypothetical protein HY928_14120 [Elusimicrobia bacterium]|nr:hypothetical protein [Elusimicrobiota bacterium]
MMPRRAALTAGFVFLAAGAAVYGPLLTAPVLYDDQVYLQANPFNSLPPACALRALASRRYFEETQERSWQPLVSAVEWASEGSPARARAVSLLALVLAGLLSALLGARLGLDERGAALAGLLVVLFPPATEAVAVASFSGHHLALAALCGTLLAFDRALEGPGAARWAAAAALAAGLMSKESALMAVPACGLLAWARGRDFRSLMTAARPMLAVTALYLVWRFGVLLPPPPLHGTEYPRTWTLPWESFGWHLRLLAAPAPLCLERVFSPGPERWARLLLPLGWGAAVWAWRRERGRLFLLGWLALAAAPTLHLVAFANLSPAADRYSVALAAPAALALAFLASYSGRRSALLASLSLAWGVLGVLRVGTLRNPDALAEQTVACAPGHPRALSILAGRRLERGDAQGAGALFARVFAAEPLFVTSFREGGLWHSQGKPYVEGLLRLQDGDAARALPLFEAAALAAREPHARAAALTRLGETLGMTARDRQASAAFAEASALAPDWALPHLNAGLMHLAAKRPAEALAALDRADERLRFEDPALRSAIFSARARANEGLLRWDRAAADWESAAAYDSMPGPWLAAARAWAKAGSPEKARRAYAATERAAAAALERLAGLGAAARPLEDALREARDEARKGK